MSNLKRIKFHKNSTSVAYSIVADGEDDGFLSSYSIDSFDAYTLLNVFNLALRTAEVIFDNGLCSVVMDDGFKEWYVSSMKEVHGNNVYVPTWKWENANE